MERRALARIFGVLGSGLFLIAGVLTFLLVVMGAVLGRFDAEGFVGGVGEAIVEVAVAVLIFLFALVGSRRTTDVDRAAGAVLIVIPIVVWFFVGRSALDLVAGLCSLVAGLLLLVGRN